MVDDTKEQSDETIDQGSTSSTGSGAESDDSPDGPVEEDRSPADDPATAGDDSPGSDDGETTGPEETPILNESNGPPGDGGGGGDGSGGPPGDDPDDDALVGNISRRDAIKGAMGGTLVAANAYLFTNIAQSNASGDEAPGVRERSSNQLKLSVNGRDRFVKVEDQERLAETLRYKLGLTGTKFGCDRAMCGACTVQVDGDPIYSCTYFTRDAVGKEIETVEGLEQGGELHPLQQSFIEELGGQCAFCTPGMIMSGKALLEENSDPDREEVKQALSGNLCRCGNYENEISSVLSAAKKM